MKRTVVVLVLIGALAAGGYYAWQSAGQKGSGAIEQWIGRQIVGVLDTYLVPKVSFDELDYEAPYSVTVRGLSLSADGVDLFVVDRIMLELAEVPSLGKPIQIRRIEADRPQVNLLTAADGRFVGWQPLLEPMGSATTRAASKVTRFSDILVLRHVTVHDARIAYGPQDDETNRMVLPGIAIDLATIPDPERPGWYTLKGECNRPPVLSIEYDAEANIDTADLEIAKITLETELGPGKYDSLPPDIQALLREHEVHGALEVLVRGQVPLTTPLDGDLSVDVGLREAGLVVDKSTWPIELVELTASLRERRLAADVMATMLSGKITATVDTGVDPGSEAAIAWKCEGVKMQDAYRAATDSDKAKYAGNVNGEGTVELSIDDPAGTLGGKGNVKITEGRLMSLPVIEDIVAVLEKVKIVPGRPLKDKVACDFSLQPERVQIDRLEMESPLLAMRASGDVFLDQRLDLLVRAGAVEKLRATLGKVGDLLATVTDKGMAYAVSGTIDDPKVTVKPLNLGG